MKKSFFSKDPDVLGREKTLLSLELSEIKDISDILFKRLEKKIQVLEAIEASVDKKIADIERLIQSAEALRAPSGSGGAIRQHEIFSLVKRGLKPHEIADILGMPVGEVDLILELHPRTS